MQTRKTKIIKTLVLGNKNIGKTSFIERYFSGDFETESKTKSKIKDIPFSFSIQSSSTFSIQSHKFTRVFEVHESEEYIPNFDCYILMFDINDLETYKDLLRFIEILKPNKINNVLKPFVIVGNKCDIMSDTAIREFSKVLDTDLYERVITFSCKSCYNIDKPFLKLIREIERNENIIYYEELIKKS
jgi:GTPase SAR1 family protein